MTGLVAALGISLHNLPEGLIVYNQSITGICASDAYSHGGVKLSFLAPFGLTEYFVLPNDISKCFNRGLAIVLAIMLHNIPEGMAVASPLYASTGSKWEAMKWTLLSSLCEPLAALVFGSLFSSFLTPHIIALLNAVVAGIMISLCLIELIPASAEHIGAKNAVMSNILGQFVMFISLQAMRSAGVH